MIDTICLGEARISDGISTSHTYSIVNHRNPFISQIIEKIWLYYMQRVLCFMILVVFFSEMTQVVDVNFRYLENKYDISWERHCSWDNRIISVIFLHIVFF